MIETEMRENLLKQVHFRLDKVDKKIPVSDMKPR